MEKRNKKNVSKKNFKKVIFNTIIVLSAYSSLIVAMFIWCIKHGIIS